MASWILIIFVVYFPFFSLGSALSNYTWFSPMLVWRNAQTIVISKGSNHKYCLIKLSLPLFSSLLETIICLWRKVVCFFCLFVTLRFSQTLVPSVTFLVPLESGGWVRVHQVGFKMFQPMLEKSYLNIEQFFALKIHLNQNSKL
jgi:hypothetical protein